jgi:predicted thioesterase
MIDVPIGTAGEHRLLVTPEWTIDFLGSDEARVFATPFLIGYLELTARNAIKPYLAENEDSVGTVVNVRHLAATPVGMSVRFHARVLSVDGRRVQFHIEAWDEKEKVAEGTHERFVVNIPRFISSLAMKRSQS